MKEMPLSEFLAQFDEETAATCRQALEREGITALVLFENQNFDASQFGAQSVLTVGPSGTFKSPEECEGRPFGDLPSNFKYPVSFAYASEAETTTKRTEREEG